MKSKLRQLRSRLRRLRRRRSLVRRGTALSSLLLMVVWSAVALFALDWSFAMNPLQRIVGLAAFALIAVWVLRRFLPQVLGRGETLIDVALLVERTYDINSDVVAALQFETAAAQTWGSRQLESAVVEDVATSSRRLDVFRGFSYERFGHRALGLAATVLLVGLAIVLYPRHAAVFLDRLLLGSACYPTHTIIEEIAVNGQVVLRYGQEPQTVRAAYGKPLQVTVRCSGRLPELGIATLHSQRTDAETQIELRRLQPGASGNDSAPSYGGILLRLVTSLSCQVDLGDATSGLLLIHVIPAAAVSVALQPTPPAYATPSDDRTADSVSTHQASARHISVVEGSRVDVRVECKNKTLRHAVFTIDEQDLPLTAQSSDGRVWQLSGPDTPLSRITQPLRYQVQVEDGDGLTLDVPISGSIRIKPDRSPRVVAKMLSTLVLPTARPRISYGLSRLRVRFQVERQSGETEETSRDLKVITPAEQPVKVLQGRDPLDLDSLGLTKGDQLKITLEAFDYRGELPAQLSVSEPLILQVTDREGILAGLLETDEESARRLDEIIQRELGIGDTP